jgi:hypothetical protein
MRKIVVAAALGFLLAGRASAADWTPAVWANENTVELRTTDPGEQPYWFPVWLAVVDGQLYVRLGSRAAGRFDRNVTKPILGVRIAGQTFERIRAVLAPDMTDRVRDVMADKYWTQGDFIVRRLNHPYLLRLEPEAASPAS